MQAMGTAWFTQGPGVPPAPVLPAPRPRALGAFSDSVSVSAPPSPGRVLPSLESLLEGPSAGHLVSFTSAQMRFDSTTGWLSFSLPTRRHPLSLVWSQGILVML